MEMNITAPELFEQAPGCCYKGEYVGDLFGPSIQLSKHIVTSSYNLVDAKGRVIGGRAVVWGTGTKWYIGLSATRDGERYGAGSHLADAVSFEAAVSQVETAFAAQHKRYTKQFGAKTA